LADFVIALLSAASASSSLSSVAYLRQAPAILHRTGINNDRSNASRRKPKSSCSEVITSDLNGVIPPQYPYQPLRTKLSKSNDS
jgi:hypothetical protein